MPELVSRREEGSLKTEGGASCTAVQEEVEATKGQSVWSIGITLERSFACVLFLVADGNRVLTCVYR